MGKGILKPLITVIVIILGLGLFASGHIKQELKFLFNSNSASPLMTPSSAQAITCDDYVDQGRFALMSKDPVAAHDLFSQALECDSSHQEANFFYAVTRLLTILYGSEADNIMDRFGISPAGRDIYNWYAEFQYDLEGRIIWPSNSPTVDELIGTLNNTVLPEIEGALANLDKVDSGFNIMLHQDEILTDIPMEADHGDVLAAKAFLTAAKGAIKILNAYNFSLDIDELVTRADSGEITNINDFLSFYSGFFHLKSGAGTQLAEAKAFLKEAINGYFTASEFIRSENDDQGNDLIAIDAEGAMDEAEFRSLISQVKDSLDGPAQFCGKAIGNYYLVVSGHANGFIKFHRDICDSSATTDLWFEGFSVSGDGGGPYSGIEAILPFASHSSPLKFFPPEVGQTWSSEGENNGYTVDSTSEVMSLSETVSVTSGNFTNCAKVEETLTYPDGYTPGQTYPVKFERWFAPGVGAVKLMIYLSDGGMYSGELTSYQDIPSGLDDYFPLGQNYTWTFKIGLRSATWMVTDADEELEHVTIDGSKFFNGLDIRDHIPDFDDCDYPVYGTLDDPTFNGMLPGFDREYWWKNIFSLREYYVSPSGNDDNVGNSPASALRTIYQAGRRAGNWGFRSGEPGCDIIIDVAAGTYNRASGEEFPIETEENNIILQGAGPDVTTIDASGGSDTVIDISRGTLDGFTITGGNGYYCGGVDAGHATVSNCVITGNTAYGDAAGIAARDSLITNCTISNNHGGDGGEWGSHGGGINSDGSIISNCVIQGNSVTGGGGGMNLHNSPTSIINSIISGNSAGWGGGIQNWESSPTIIDCIISSNTARDSGGGIQSGESSPTITNSTIRNNRAENHSGGGINLHNSSPVITDSTISGNTANNGGGGISCNESSPTITNSLITDNTASNGGGGMDCWQSSPVITNCAFSGNTANWGGGINFNGVSSPVIVNTILWGNKAGSNPNEINQSYQSFVSINYSDFNPSYFSGSVNWSGSNNINDNPLFVDPVNSNYHLQSGSPCIDAANSNDPAQANDRDGKPRHDDPATEPNTGTGANGSYYDMGAYEYQGTCSSGERRSCNTGQLGVCADGTQTCDGSRNWGVCEQDTQASDELCDDRIDNDCDGKTDEGCSGGDVNEDGNITPQDALMAFQHYLGLIELNASQQSLADVNNSSSITPADALCIFQKYLGLPSCLD